MKAIMKNFCEKLGEERDILKMAYKEVHKIKYERETTTIVDSTGQLMVRTWNFGFEAAKISIRENPEFADETYERAWKLLKKSKNNYEKLVDDESFMILYLAFCIVSDLHGLFSSGRFIGEITNYDLFIRLAQKHETGIDFICQAILASLRSRAVIGNHPVFDKLNPQALLKSLRKDGTIINPLCIPAVSSLLAYYQLPKDIVEAIIKKLEEAIVNNTNDFSVADITGLLKGSNIDIQQKENVPTVKQEQVTANTVVPLPIVSEIEKPIKIKEKTKKIINTSILSETQLDILENAKNSVGAFNEKYQTMSESLKYKLKSNVQIAMSVNSSEVRDYVSSLDIEEQNNIVYYRINALVEDIYVALELLNGEVDEDILLELKESFVNLELLLSSIVSIDSNLVALDGNAIFAKEMFSDGMYKKDALALLKKMESNQLGRDRLTPYKGVYMASRGSVCAYYTRFADKILLVDIVEFSSKGFEVMDMVMNSSVEDRISMIQKTTVGSPEYINFVNANMIVMSRDAIDNAFVRETI